MEFHPEKCQVLNITKRHNPVNFTNTIHGHPLEAVQSAKYLGAFELTNNLSWNKHLETTTMKGKRSLGFLRRNLGTCPPEIKARCYNTFVRPIAEYASCIWSPSTKKGIDKVESIQWSAARYVINDYARQSSDTTMLQDLGWLFNTAEMLPELPWCTALPTSWLTSLTTINSFLPTEQQEATTRSSKFLPPVPPWWKASSSLTQSVSGMLCLSKLWTRQHWMSLKPGSAMSGSPNQMSPHHQFLTLYIFFMPVNLSAPVWMHLNTCASILPGGLMHSTGRWWWWIDDDDDDEILAYRLWIIPDTSCPSHRTSRLNIIILINKPERVLEAVIGWPLVDLCVTLDPTNVLHSHGQVFFCPKGYQIW